MQPLPPELKEFAPYIHAVSPYLQQYGYWAIFVGVLLEDFGIPVPGETLLIAGSLFAGIGSFKIQWVVVLGFAGAVIGDNIGYAIGYFGGRPFVLRFGQYFFLSRERLRKLEHIFQHHGGKIVVVARFIEGLRQFNGLIAGTSHMRWPRFFIFNLIGAGLWVGAWVSAAYFLGQQLGTIIKTFKRFEFAILIGIGAAVFLSIVIYLVKKRTGNSEKS